MSVDVALGIRRPGPQVWSVYEVNLSSGQERELERFLGRNRRKRAVDYFGERSLEFAYEALLTGEED